MSIADKIKKNYAAVAGAVFLATTGPAAIVATTSTPAAAQDTGTTTPPCDHGCKPPVVINDPVPAATTTIDQTAVTVVQVKDQNTLTGTVTGTVNGGDQTMTGGTQTMTGGNNTAMGGTGGQGGQGGVGQGGTGVASVSGVQGGSVSGVQGGSVSGVQGGTGTATVSGVSGAVNVGGTTVGPQTQSVGPQTQSVGQTTTVGGNNSSYYSSSKFTQAAGNGASGTVIANGVCNSGWSAQVGTLPVTGGFGKTNFNEQCYAKVQNRQTLTTFVVEGMQNHQTGLSKRALNAICKAEDGIPALCEKADGLDDVFNDQAAAPAAAPVTIYVAPDGSQAQAAAPGPMPLASMQNQNGMTASQGCATGTHAVTASNGAQVCVPG